MSDIITTDKQIITVKLIEREIVKVELIVVDVLNGSGTGTSLNIIKNEVPTKLTAKKFRLINNYKSGSLTVYFNGIKEKYILETSSNEFELEIDTVVDDTIEVDYIKI